jgi:hypothetical protein
MNVIAQTLRDTVARAQTHPQWLGIPVVVVVSRDLVYGLERMYQILVEESLAPTEIFHDTAPFIVSVIARGVIRSASFVSFAP